MTIIEQLSALFEQALSNCYPQLDLKIWPVEIAPSTKAHYQCNSAMKWARPLKLSPQVIANTLKDALLKLGDEMFQSIEIAGPGFCNITLSPDYLAKFLQRAGWDLAKEKPLEKRRILIDFSCPNIAKEMHVGHLRSTIIGDSLAKIMQHLGATVLRINHLGDWGTQFGMLIAHLEQNPQKELDLTKLMAIYQAAKLQFDQDEQFKKKAQQKVIALQSKEPSALGMWQTLCKISQVAFDEIYQVLQIELTSRGESHYNSMLVPMVEDLQARGQLTLSSGAKCIFIAGFEIPLMVQKTDGGFSYDATDLAALRYRVLQDRADEIIYVTDAGQSLHFQLLFAAARQIGYLPPNVLVHHVPFGLVLGDDGKKFRTRSGTTVKLKSLLDEACVRALCLVEEKNPQGKPEELKKLADALGLSAVKYADLSNDRKNDYTFSYSKMLRFEGNTAPFLLYSLVRSISISKRLRDSEFKVSDELNLSHRSEIELALLLARYPEALKATARDFAPHRLAHHLYAIAQGFNAFFRDCPVINSPHQNSRAHLTRLFEKILREGIELLGLFPVTSM